MVRDQPTDSDINLSILTKLSSAFLFKYLIFVGFEMDIVIYMYIRFYNYFGSAMAQW